MIKFFKNIYYLFKIKNFSQSDEENVLLKVFNNKKTGFYVDVGCHHPMRFSNTAKLYKNGWSGINIDADSSNMRLFRLFRKRDKNINALISEKPEKLKYYYFDDSALNGILSFQKVNSLKNLGYKVINEQYIVTQRLDNIITNFEIKNHRIDLLDIDVEGYDFQVLKSIDLSLFDVRVILIETGDNENEIAKYLLKYNYSFYKKIDRNSFFLKDSI